MPKSSIGLFLILFFSGCSALTHKEINPELNEPVKIYFAEEKIRTEKNQFDTFSGITLLSFNLAEKEMAVSETKINFITYNSGFISRMKTYFPEALLHKYKIITTTRSGKIVSISPGYDLEVKFNHLTSSASEDDSIESVITGEGLNKKTATGVIHEKALYRRISDTELWKAISSEITADDNILIWKNQKGSLSFLKPFTEFSPDVRRTYHSSDYDYNSLQFKKLQIDKNTVIATLAFRDRNYAAYYCLNQISGSNKQQQFVTLVRKQRIHPLKVLNPYIITKRNGK